MVIKHSGFVHPGFNVRGLCVCARACVRVCVFPANDQATFVLLWVIIFTVVIFLWIRVWMQGMSCRAVRASHILVSSCGQACLSGLRYACQIVEHGRWQCSVHSFPRSTAPNLNWLSPEVLEQVSITVHYVSPLDKNIILWLVCFSSVSFSLNVMKVVTLMMEMLGNAVQSKCMWNKMNCIPCGM